ncbi:RHS repeat domain-containing protein [Bernardetia sp. OM2101]|uniref:RHS repeat domain-containing protein n=1 Tax=Bernardetia sp. OM2101 TaxID=3344876 RepID=UPI0035CEEEDF
MDFVPVIKNIRELNRAKRAKDLEPDSYHVPRGELVVQLRDSTDSLIVEKRQKITISATVSWQKLVSEFTAEEGEVTVFIDNSDTEPVYFDNLELRVESDPTLVITQEHHYYPFGMNMSGIERQGDLMYQFNGMIEKEEAFGLELYETPFRSYDAQLGRFWQVEPLADEFHSISMFQFGFNNPISANDPSGLRTIYTLTGPEKVRGLSDFISDREAREKNQGQHYNWDTGRYENGRGQALSWESVYGSLATSGQLKQGKRVYTSSQSRSNYGPSEAGDASEHQQQGQSNSFYITVSNESVQSSGISSFFTLDNIMQFKGQDDGGLPSGEILYSWNDFYDAYKDDHRMLGLVVNDRNEQAGQLFAGPLFRYVEDPLNGKLIDMRHFFVIGMMGNTVGALVEIGQDLGGHDESAYQSSDFYSNYLGHSFYNFMALVYPRPAVALQPMSSVVRAMDLFLKDLSLRVIFGTPRF